MPRRQRQRTTSTTTTKATMTRTTTTRRGQRQRRRRRQRQRRRRRHRNCTHCTTVLILLPLFILRSRVFSAPTIRAEQSRTVSLSLSLANNPFAKQRRTRRRKTSNNEEKRAALSRVSPSTIRPSLLFDFERKTRQKKFWRRKKRLAAHY